MLPLTLQFLVAMVACAISKRQQMALEYKTEEVLVPKDILKAVTGKERIASCAITQPTVHAALR
jgi:hypothetical protein